MPLFSPDGVRQERTGWRDQAISLRHRTWGFNCPGVDFDFLMLEYSTGKPVAVVEYKHYRARMPDREHPNYRALSHLCNYQADGPLPLLLVFYWPDDWAFRVFPVNPTARLYFREGQWMTERQYVTRLYELRLLTIEDSVLERLRNTLPARTG